MNPSNDNIDTNIAHRLFPRLMASAAWIEGNGWPVPIELEKAIAFSMQVATRGGTQADLDALAHVNAGLTLSSRA